MPPFNLRPINLDDRPRINAVFGVIKPKIVYAEDIEQVLGRISIEINGQKVGETNTVEQKRD